jgi:hypothetical protein
MHDVAGIVPDFHRGLPFFFCKHFNVKLSIRWVGKHPDVRIALNPCRPNRGIFKLAVVVEHFQAVVE